jgi:hypothetical protein
VAEPATAANPARPRRVDLQTLRAYGHLARGQARAQASYRTSFAIDVLTSSVAPCST